jgi:hypothetical protein
MHNCVQEAHVLDRFSRTRIGAVITLPGRQSFDKDFFVGAVLPSIVDDSALSRPKLKACGTSLHLDNTQPHLASDKYDKFWINRLLHPPGSPDLVPCDFLRFGYLRHCLEGRFFDDDTAENRGELPLR